MRKISIIIAACLLSACGTVNAGKKIVKTTGKVAVTSGKVIYKTGETTGKAVIGVGRGTAKVINRTTSTKAVQDITLSPTAKHVDRVGDKGSLREVMLTPLSDVNLRKQRIPEKLSQLKTPYDPVENQSCLALMQDIYEWDNILGPDMDRAPYENKTLKKKRRLRERSLDVAEAGVAHFVPFRKLVRAATGATNHESHIRREYRKGLARRAYLRGLAASNRC